MSHQLVISLGSNLTPRQRRVEEAMHWLQEVLDGYSASSIYETPEIHGHGRPYMNAVVEGEVSLEPDEFNRMLKRYEEQNGRDAEARSRGEVPIDLDLVVADGDILRPRDYARSFFRIGYDQIKSI